VSERAHTILFDAFPRESLSVDAWRVRRLLRLVFRYGASHEKARELAGPLEPHVRCACDVLSGVLIEDLNVRFDGTWAVPWADASQAIKRFRRPADERAPISAPLHALVDELMSANGNLAPPSGGAGSGEQG